ncbi:MAG: hypothetical protein E7369_01000 [Clostridiales bacterium]|nr:hypothetical protein [Clostridiales bacterium]
MEDKKQKNTPEQDAAIYHDEGDVLISASAGSGKTSTMITRLTRLIAEKKAKISEILAVTFTEVAASEIKSRLKAEISKKVAETGDEDLASQLAEIDTSDISTIHGFCAKLIRTYFYMVDVAPDFSVADDVVAKELKNQAIVETFNSLYKYDDVGGIGFLGLVSRYGKKRKDKDFRDIVISLYEFASEEVDAFEFLNRTLGYYTGSWYNDLCDSYLASVKERLAPFSDRLDEAYRAFMGVESDDLKYQEYAEKIKVLSCHINKIVNAKSLLEISKYCDFEDSFDNRGLKKVVLPYGRLVKSVAAELTDCIKTHKRCFLGKEDYAKTSEQLYQHSLALIEVVKRYEERYTALKREENVLDFSDLQHLALQVLSNADILRVLKGEYDEKENKFLNGKYKYIFVDEYQDVNGVQNEIISRLGADNVFMVGDLKQSIYAFRGCRADFFQNRFNEMKAAGKKTIIFNKNFRCSPAVIRAVNDVFDFSMTKEVSGVDYAKEARLDGGDAYPKEYSGRAVLHFLAKPKKEEKDKFKDGEKDKKLNNELGFYDILNHLKEPEDEGVNKNVEMIKDIIDKEICQNYYDPNPKAPKVDRITYGKIVILARSGGDKDWVKKIALGLMSRNVPVVSECEISTKDVKEIKIMLSFLSIIDCYSQDVHLATVLKSPIGKFTDEDFLEICEFFAVHCPKKVKKRTFFEAYKYYIENAEGELREKLKKFDEYVTEVRFLADFQGAGDILEKVIEDKNIESYILAFKDGRSKIKYLYKLISATSSGGKKLSVKEFLRKVELDPECIALQSEGGEDAVRIMTMHSSKGAEFPVVIVCGLERPMSKAGEDTMKIDVMMSRMHGFGVMNYDDENRVRTSTPFRWFLNNEVVKNRVMEEQRLFYVALTRAKYALHMVCATEKDEREEVFSTASKFIHYIPKSMDAEYFAMDGGLSSKKSDRREVLINEVPLGIVDSKKKILSAVYKYDPDTTLPIKSSVTEAGKAEKEEFYKVERVENISETNTVLGTNAHRILELFDFSRREEFFEQIDELKGRGLLTDTEIEGLDLEKIALAIKGAAFDGIDGKTLYREKSFIMNVPARMLYGTDSDDCVLVQGIIDLLVIDGDDAYIIDYKYSNSSEKHLKERYSTQLNLYAYAVEKGLGLKVKSKTIISLLNGKSVAID